jgi:uncharacterized tellurite resistance protein B-like protein
MGFFSSLFESRETKKRKSHIKNLLSVAASDGNISKTEVDFLVNVAKRLYMPFEELKSVLEQPQYVSDYPPESDRERIDQIHDLVCMMMIDGNIDDDEITTCKIFARKLGFKSQIIDHMVDRIIDGVARNMVKDAILNDIIRSLR